MTRIIAAAFLFSIAAVFFALAAWIKCIAPVTPVAHAAVTSERTIPDPWGRVGSDVYVTAVRVGGLECAVLIQRDGAERRSSLWCSSPR